MRNRAVRDIGYFSRSICSVTVRAFDRSSRCSASSPMRFDFGVVAGHQFDQDGVLGIEVVIETALNKPVASAISRIDVRNPWSASMVAATSRICDLRAPVASVSTGTGVWRESAFLRPRSLSMASLPVGHSAQARMIIEMIRSDPMRSRRRTAWMSLLGADLLVVRLAVGAW